MTSMLPIMQPDVVLTHRETERMLVLDKKITEKSLLSRHGGQQRISPGTYISCTRTCGPKKARGRLTPQQATSCCTRR